MNQEMFTKEYIYKKLKEFNPVGSKISQIKKNIIKYINDNNISITEFNSYFLGSPYFYQSHHKNSLMTLIAFSELKKDKNIDLAIPYLNNETKKIFINKLKSGLTNQEVEKILKSTDELNIRFDNSDLFYIMISHNIYNIDHFKNIFFKDDLIKNFFINSFIKHMDNNTLPNFEEESYAEDSKINKFSREILSDEQYKELYSLIKKFKEFIKENEKDNSLLYIVRQFPEYINDALIQNEFTSFEESDIQLYKEIEFNPITFNTDNILTILQKSKDKLHNSELIINNEFQFSDKESIFDLFYIKNRTIGEALTIFNEIILNIDINPFIPYKNNKNTLFDFIIDIFNVMPIKGYQVEITEEAHKTYIKWIDDNKKYFNPDIQTDKIKQPLLKGYIENIILDINIKKQPLNIKKNRL